MDAKRAQWFHDMADMLEPGGPAEREARFEARMADAEARLSALRAEYMWDFAGGRPEPAPGDPAAKPPTGSASDPNRPVRPTAPGASTPVPPSTTAPRSGDTGGKPDGTHSGQRSKPLGTNPNETPTVEVKRTGTNPDETPTVEVKRPEQSNPDETPTVELKRPEQSNPDETPTVELKRPEQSNPDETPTVEIPRQEAESPKPPADPADASPGLQAALDRLRAADPVAGERPRSLEDQVYGARLTDALGVVEALAKRPDALSALRHFAETAAAEGVFHDPENGLGTRPHAPEGGEPRTLTLEELRTELLRRLGLPETTADDALPRIVGDEQLRNLLRAGGIEALRDAVLQHDELTGPERERAARARDGWARLLGVDDSLLDPARTTPEQRRAVLDELRAETLRRASDAADLMVASFYRPDADHTHVVLDADGERVHIRITEDADGNKRAEVIQRPDLPRETPPETKEPEKQPGWLKRMWQRMMHGYQGQSPKYPSGSGNDSKGQTMLAMEIGYLTHDEALLHLKDKFNPARILKESATLWKERERLPLVRRLTARVADVAAELRPMRTLGGGEYRPWVSEADPRIRADVEKTLRGANMPIESEMPEPQHEPLDRGPALEPPAPREWGTDLPQPLVDAVTTRDAALGDLVRLADDLGIRIPDDDPKTLRGVVDDAIYKLMRRAGAVEALRDVSERWLMEDAQIPFSREVSIFDKDPLGRYLREFARAEALRTEEEKAARRREEAGVGPDDDSLEFRPRRPRVSFLDLQGVNNGGEWPRHFDDADEELSNRREGRLFEDALRRDQIQDERSNWSQLLEVDLKRLETEDGLKQAIAEERMANRDQGRRLLELDAAVNHFLDLDTSARQHAADLAETAAHDWVNEHGGAVLDREHGLAVLPGEPRRLVVIRGEADHDARLVDALAAHPEIREQFNRGELSLDYRVVGLDLNDRVQVAPVEPPQVRFHEVEVNGERTPVALLRNGLEPWRIVQPTAEPVVHAEPPAEPAAPRDPDVVRRERNDVASRLSVYRMDLGENLARTIADLEHDNSLRAAQIEGMADFIRSSDAIDNFHDLERTLQNLTHRLGLKPDELTPQKLAEAMADPNVRKVRRLQAVDDLVKYAKVLRENIDEKAVLAARKELAARLDVEPDELAPAKPDKQNGEIVGFKPDTKNTDKNALLDAINNLLHDSRTRPELLAALTEFSSVLGNLDPFLEGLRYDPLTDPRAVDGELPIHDGDAPALLREYMNDYIGEPPLSDNPSAAAGVWSRLLGVQMNDFAKTVKIYAEQLGGLHDRVTPAQFADVLTTLRETGDSTVAWERYRDSSADPAKVVTREQLSDLVRGVRNARYAEVYEAYRDGKIEKHERRSASDLADTIHSLRAEVQARDADIKLLKKLAAEHYDLTNPRPPEGPPRDPRAVAAGLAAARHELQIAAEGRDYAQGRVYRERGEGFRPLHESDLTPEHLPGTADYLANRPAEEGGTLPGLEQRLSDLDTAAHEFDQAQTRLRDLEAEMQRAVTADVRPGESPVDAWRREVDTARAELDELIAADPKLAQRGFDAVMTDLDRLSGMPQQWGDVFTDELVPLRDAAHRYEQASEFLSAAEADAAAAARAAETPEQTAARELATARDDLAAADAGGDTARRDAAADRIARWEAEQRRLEADAAAAAETPHQAADRARTAAHDDLTRAIEDFRRTTGLDVTETELAPEHLRDTVNRLLPEARGTVPEVVGAFERLENAARALHRADALTEWVDTHFPESGHPGREGEDPGASGAPTRPQGPTQPNTDPSAAARNPEGDGHDGGSNALTRDDSGDADVNRSFARRVEDAIAAGEADAVVLSTGMGRMAERVELVTFATEPPTQLIRKVVTNPQHAHAEALVSLVGQAVGANVPKVHRVEERVVYMEVMPGEVGADRFTTTMDAGLDEVLATPDGRRLGLLDVLVGIPDRNLVNWLITADGQISGIDHSLAFGGGRRGDELSTSLFARQYATEGPDGEITWHEHDLSPQDLSAIRARLEALAPDFAALAREDWHRALMDRFDEVQRHARASDEGRTGDEGDPGPTPARPSNPTRPGSSPSAATPPLGATPPGSGGGGKEPPNRNSSTPPNPDPEEPGNSGRNGQNSTPPSKPGDGQTAKLPEGSEDPTINLSAGGEESTKKLPEGSEDPTIKNPPPGEASTSKPFEGNDDPTVNMSRGENASNEQTFEGNDDPTVKNPPPGEPSTSKSFEGNDDPTVKMEGGSGAKPPGSEDPTVELPKPEGSEDPTVELPKPSEAPTLELPRVEVDVPPVDPVADSPALNAVAQFLREATNDPTAPGREVNAVVFTARLMDALGLEGTAAHLHDPLAHFREIAEMAKARGFFGDPDQAAGPRPMRDADDYRPLAPEEVYGTEEYWRTEADPETLRAIESELEASGLDRRLAELESGDPARALDPSGPTGELPTSAAHPDGRPVRERPLETWSQRPHDPASAEPRVHTLDELRTRLAAEFGLSETDLLRANLPHHVGDMQFRNMLRAGGLEALDHVLAAHDTATGLERENLARVRDEWARLLGIPESALDPAHTTPEQRNTLLAEARTETLRRAMDVADLLVAALHVAPREHLHLVLEADGERVHARVVDHPDGKRIELLRRPDLGVQRTSDKVAPGWVDQLWRRMMHGYHGQSPKYPSGSRWDSFGQSTMAVEFGHMIHDDALIQIKDKFNPVRIAKEIVTFWQARERLPLVNHLTRRIADISPQMIPMRTLEGGEYRPHVTEADPVLRAEVEESLRLAEMTIESELPEPQHIPIDQVEIKEPPPREWGADVPQPLADAVDARDAALLEVVRAARENRIRLTAEGADALRYAAQEARYRVARRAGAIEALHEAALNWIVEDAFIPFSREVSIFDKDPLGRFMREVAHAKALQDEELKAQSRREEAGVDHDDPPLEYRAREPRPSFLDVVGVNNGGEWALHFDDVDGEELSNSREGVLFERALKRDQMQEARSNWAQLLDVGLDRIETRKDLENIVSDLRMDIRRARAQAAEFAAVVDHFLGVDGNYNERVREVSDAAARDWVNANCGVMLDREHGLAVLPGERGGPERLVVIRGDIEHDTHLVDALAAHPDLRGRLNRGELRLDYRDVGLDDNGRVRVDRVEPPSVRFHDVEVDGHPVPVALMRAEGGDSWRLVQPTPEPVVPPHPEPSTEPAVPHDPDELRKERNQVAGRLAIYDLDLGQNLDRTIAGLRQDLLLRHAQLEGMADFIRTSDAIDTLNGLDRALGNLANRLGLDPEQLSPRKLAEAFADTRIRMGERRHQAFADLVNYADVLRKNIDEPAALAARDRLVSKLGVDPAELHKLKAVKDEEKVDIVGFEPDKKSTAPVAIAEAFENLIFRPDERRAQAIDALTEYIGALADLDPHRDGGLRYDPRTDPRAVTGDIPVHDPKVPVRLDALDSDLVGEPLLLDIPTAAGEIWQRLLGVDPQDIEKTVKLYTERLERLHDRMSPDQLREVLRTRHDTNTDMAAAYRVYRDSVTDPAKLLTAEQVSEVVRVVHRARYIEVYEAYRDGKIEKHERLTPKELSKAIDSVRSDLRAREANIDLLEQLASEHHNLTNPPEPEAPPRDPRTVGPELAAVRHELQIAEEGLDYVKGRMWRERDGGEFRPLTDSDLTPDRLPGTEDWLTNRARAEGGELPGNEQRVNDLSTAAREFDRAQARVRELETELRRGMEATAEPDETPADAWRREAEAARADLEALVTTDPAAPRGIDHAIDQIEQLSRMPLTWDDIWTDDLVPLRDAVHRYQRAEEFLAATRTAEADAAAAAARAAETPEQTAARELAKARDELAAAEAQGDTARRDAAADRAARWEAEQRRIADAAAADADTPRTAAQRAREEAHNELRSAIEDLRRTAGLDVTELELASNRLRDTITDLLAQAHGPLQEVVRAFDRLQSAAEAFHAAEAIAHWVDNHYPDPVRAIEPGEGEPGGPKRLGPGTPPTDPTGGAPARPGPTKPGTDPAATAKQPESGAQPVPPVTHSSTATTHSGSDESTGQHENGSTPEQNGAPEQNAGAPTGSNWVVVEPGTVHTWSDPRSAAWADGAMAQARAAVERHDLAIDDLHAVARQLGADPDRHRMQPLRELLLSQLATEVQHQEQLRMTPEGMGSAEAVAQMKAADKRIAELTDFRLRIEEATRVARQAEREAKALLQAVYDEAVKDILAATGASMRAPSIGMVYGDPNIVVVVSSSPDPLAVLGEENVKVVVEGNLPLVAKLVTLDFDGVVHVNDLTPPPPPPESTPPSNPPTKPPTSPGSPGRPGAPVTHGASGHGTAEHGSQPSASTPLTPEPPTAVVITEVHTPPADVDGAVIFEGNLPDGPGATPLYRGVPRLLPDGTVNPAYLDGLRGIVPARGDLDLDYNGHTSHLGSQSDATSWSRNPTIAAHFAGTDGLIMEWRTGAPPEGATWRFKPTYDLDDLFSQVLIQGTLTDARATRHLPPAPAPEPPPTPPTPEPPPRPPAVPTATPSLGLDAPTPAKPNSDTASQLPPVESPQGSDDSGALGNSAPEESGESAGPGHQGTVEKPTHQGAEEPKASEGKGDSDGFGASGDVVQPGQGDSGGASDGSEPASAGESGGSGGTGEHVGSGRSDGDDPDESGSGSTSEPDAGDGGRSDDASTDDAPFHYNPNWRSHLPLVPHQFDPEFPDYTPKPSEQPAPWTLPPDPNPPHNPPQPHQPQPTPHQPTPQPHQPTPPQVPVPPNTLQPPHIPQPPNLPQPPQPQPPQPQPPHLPQPPSIPTPPQWPTPPHIPVPPNMPEPPYLPQPPHIPGMPQLPTPPQWPHLPSNPGTPDWPNGTGGQHLSQQPSFPGGPQSPVNPGSPQAPASPDSSNLPQWLRDALGSQQPVQSGVPEVAQQPHPHAGPDTPRWVGDSADAGNSGVVPGGSGVSGGGDSGANGGGFGAGSGAGAYGGNGAGQGFPGGAPMMPPQGASGGGNGNGNSRGGSRFPRASGRPASGGQIYLRSHSGFGEYALMDPMTGQLSAAPVGTGAPAGVFDDLDGLRVVFYRDPVAGLVLRVGDQVIELDRLAAGALWERSGQGLVRLLIGSPSDVRCELRYSERPVDSDLGLLIRDVLSDPSRRLGIFG
ncbi:hypothetical protein [Nocardia tengchongensis]|uniref:hypothetical protein n=1 Tax=Nocardia tengchongensis TaxID=2055889 RepID=UPI0036C0018F